MDEMYVEPSPSTIIEVDPVKLIETIKQAKEDEFFSTLIKELFSPFKEKISLSDYEKYVENLYSDELADIVNREFIRNCCKMTRDEWIKELPVDDSFYLKSWADCNYKTPDQLGPVNKDNIYDYYLLCSDDWPGDDPDWVLGEGAANGYLRKLELDWKLTYKLEEIIVGNKITETIDATIWDINPNTENYYRDHDTLRRLFTEEFEKLEKEN